MTTLMAVTAALLCACGTYLILDASSAASSSGSA